MTILTPFVDIADGDAFGFLINSVTSTPDGLSLTFIVDYLW